MSTPSISDIFNNTVCIRLIPAAHTNFTSDKSVTFTSTMHCEVSKYTIIMHVQLRSSNQFQDINSQYKILKQVIIKMGNKSSYLLTWLIAPVQNFGKMDLPPSNLISWMTNGQRWRTLFREKYSRASRTTVLAPSKAHSIAKRRPHGPAPTIKTCRPSDKQLVIPIIAQHFR